MLSLLRLSLIIAVPDEVPNNSSEILDCGMRISRAAGVLAESCPRELRAINTVRIWLDAHAEHDTSIRRDIAQSDCR